MRREEFELASLHEAGHAVATVALGGIVEYVDLDSCLLAEHCELAPWESAVTCMAGAAAARRFGPGWRSSSRDVSTQDRDVALHYLAKIGLATSEGLREAERQAERVVLVNDRHVERVASALRERGRLSGAEVCAIMGAGAPVPYSVGRTEDDGFFVVQERGDLWDAFPEGQEEALGSGVGDSEAEAVGALAGALTKFLGHPVKLVKVGEVGELDEAGHAVAPRSRSAGSVEYVDLAKVRLF